MRCEKFMRLCSLVVVAMLVGASGSFAAEEKSPEQAGEQVAVEGTFVRVAANQEGWVVTGYRIANESVGEKWMLLDIGLSLTQPNSSHRVTRDDIKLVTPDGQVLSLPTQEEFEKVRGSLIPLVKRAAMVGDSINYFPQDADHLCHIELFTEPGLPRPQLVKDDVYVTSNDGCVGRVYFEVPGAIQLGNYNLDVKFADSIVKVPMEIMTKERAKDFEKEWKKALKESRKKK